MGMDSLTAMEFRDRLESHLGISLPSTLALDYSSVDTLATFLLTKLNGNDVHPEPEVPTRPELALSSLALRVQEMSEEQVEELLLKKLAGL
jgi:hypothetical protein